jgi:hypothetical protein
MKILAYDHLKSGVIREIYGRVDTTGAVITFEGDSVDEVTGHVADFPLSKVGFLEWDFLALTAPFPFEVLFAVK